MPPRDETRTLSFIHIRIGRVEFRSEEGAGPIGIIVGVLAAGAISLPILAYEFAETVFHRLSWWKTGCVVTLGALVVFLGSKLVVHYLQGVSYGRSARYRAWSAANPGAELTELPPTRLADHLFGAHWLLQVEKKESPLARYNHSYARVGFWAGFQEGLARLLSPHVDREFPMPAGTPEQTIRSDLRSVKRVYADIGDPR